VRKLFVRAWNIGKVRVGGSKASEWTLFLYRDDRPNRAELAKHLSVAPESLTFLMLDGRPLLAEGEEVATGDARLDQALTICAANQMALPLDPKELARLPDSPWSSPKAAEHWKVGVAVSEILKRGPPEGWGQIEYRLASRRGGRASVVWVPDVAEPRAAIAKALRVEDDAIALKESPWPKHSEERSTPVPWVAPLNFASRLQDEPADVGLLLIAPIFLGKAGAISPVSPLN